MKKYVKPSIETVVLEAKDIITTSNIINNGEKTHQTENGTVFTGQEGTFVGWFDRIW